MPKAKGAASAGRHGRSSDSNLADVAYRHVLDLILRGKVPMGGEIKRREIAARLKMSLLPVSEALQRLEQELLVESGRRVGTRVRIPTPQDIRGFCAVREALETQAARMFAERATPAECAELRKMASDLDAFYEQRADEADRAGAEDMHRLRMAHMQFHLRIAEGARCAFLYQQVEKNQHLVFSSFYDHLFGRRRLPHRWHSLVADAIASGNAGAADAAMRAHVRHHLEEIMYRLEPYLSLDRTRLARTPDTAGV